MDQITYHRATNNDISILVENRILFAIEFSGNQSQASVQALDKQMTDYFSRATADDTCISFIAKSDGMVAGIGSVHLRETPGNFRNPSG